MNQHRGTKHHHRHHHKHKHGHRHGHGIDWRDWFSRYFVAICIAVLVPVVGVCGLTGWRLYQAYLYENRYGPALESELGFALESEEVRAGGRNVEVTVIRPVSGGYMERIGFRDGDVLTSHTAAAFYELLHNNRGPVLNVRVVNGGDGAPIDQREVRTRKFVIPQKAS